MERERIIQGLNQEIESLARLHIQHRLDNTEGFRQQKASIERYIAEYRIDLRRELDPLSLNLYRRYFG